MAILIVQTKKSTTATASPAITLTSVVAGNLLVLVATALRTTSPVPVLSSVSGGGATWARAVPLASAAGTDNAAVEIWYGTGGTGGSITVTPTWPQANSNADYALMEVSGAASVSPLDTTGSQNNTPATTTAPCPVLTPGVANCLFVAGTIAYGTLTQATLPLTNSFVIQTTSGTIGGAATFIATDALAHGTTFTQNTSAASVSVAATFKPPGAGTREPIVMIV